MKNLFFTIGFLAFICTSCATSKNSDEVFVKGNVSYDFTLAGLSVNYIETADSSILQDITNTVGLKLLYNHANWSGNNDEKLSPGDFAKTIIDRNHKQINISQIRSNLQFAKDSIAATDYPQKICLQYLPAGFSFHSKLCFTVGYDLGIVYQNNASVNLAHKHYLENPSELKYYSIHELHHAGFVQLKKNYMPSLSIKTCGEMAELIAYFTHLEGMAVYAAYEERLKNNALGNDQDYVALQDTALMRKYTNRYFEIYNHFLCHSKDTLTENDWSLLGELSSDKRLWYRVGAEMAATIDEKSGRAKLTRLIAEPSENFIKTYQLLAEK
jgi:hypothetical protein